MANVLSLVSYNIIPAKTGGQKGINSFNEYLSQLHNLTCITVKNNDPALTKYTLLNLLSNSKLRYYNVFYFFTISRVIKKYQASHLIVEHPYYGWLGLLLKVFCKIKMITHSHNIEARRFKSLGKWWWPLLTQYEKYTYRQSDRIFCINEEDRRYIIDTYKVRPDKCIVITYGIEWAEPPRAEERVEAKKQLQNKYDLLPGTVVYLFNGTLEYLPNLAAVIYILDKINPALMAAQLDYKIILCGKNLPAHLNGLKGYADKNIIYAGFVDDISVYFKGADIFINPVIDGGGIKTKLVEALGYNQTAVSTYSGATGVEPRLCNGKLLLVKDNDWQHFAEKMKEATAIKADIPAEYFEHFYWGNIARKAAQVINDL